MMNATTIFFSSLRRRRPFLSPPRPFTTHSTVIVYTDGACKNNGREASQAGIGVWFAAGDERNVSQRLEGKPQTNQRAELAAAIAALERVREDNSVEIRSDSRYVVTGVSVWLKTWRQNGFISSKRTRVANIDLWRQLDALLRSRDLDRRETRFVWVRAHDGVPGNEDADALASEAASARSAKGGSSCSRQEELLEQNETNR